MKSFVGSAVAATFSCFSHASERDAVALLHDAPSGDARSGITTNRVKPKMKHLQSVATTALRLSPLALLIVAAFAFGQDRYNFGSHMYLSGWVYYYCGSAAAKWGNDRATSIEKDRAEALLDAGYNMDTIDNYSTPPVPPQPGRGKLRKVAEWILYAVELTDHTYEQYKNYNKQKIISDIHSHYDQELEKTDQTMHDWTGNCAAQQAAQNAWDDAQAGITSYTYIVAWSGFNYWLGLPVKRTRTSVEGPL